MLSRENVKRYVIVDGLGVLAFGLIVGFLTQDFLYSFAAGLSGVYLVDLFTALHHSFLRSRLQRLPRIRRVLMEICISFVSHFLGIFIGIALIMLIFGYLSTSVILFLIAVAVTAPALHSVQYARMFYRELRETELQEERLKALAAEAEVKALKAQINPHFLFNTLNTIAHLVRTDPQRAEQAVEKLAETFRYALFAFEKEVVPLEQELAFIDDYLDLEKERFGDRLKVRRSIAADALTVMVPPLILQPLVENALKHGQGPRGEVELGLAASLTEESLEIVITDNGSGMPAHIGKVSFDGIGLRNVRDRLEKTYGQEYGLESAANEPQGAQILIRIPRERR